MRKAINHKADPAPTYVRLFNMLRAIREMSPFCELTADEERLLDELLVRWHGSKRITVSDIMRDIAHVPQTTTYRRLIALRDKGLVDLQVDEDDRRVKFVLPTSVAERYKTLVSDTLKSIAADEKLA